MEARPRILVAEPTLIPNAIQNWRGLVPEERWWLPDLGSVSIGELLDVDISGIASGQQLSWI